MDIAKTVIEFHQLLDDQIFREKLTSFIKQHCHCDEPIELDAILNNSIFQIVKIGEGECNVGELVTEFQHYIEKFTNDYLQRLYYAVIENLLNLQEPTKKESLISDLYLMLSNLILDAEMIHNVFLGYTQTRDLLDSSKNDDKNYDDIWDVISLPNCVEPFEIIYYSTLHSSFSLIQNQIFIRFKHYVNESVLKTLKEQEGEDRIPMMGLRTKDIDAQESSKGIRLVWDSNKSNLAELAAALIATDSIKLHNLKEEEQTDGKIGAYLYMLLDAQKSMTPDEYYRQLNDIKQRNDRVVFIEELKHALVNYIEEGRKSILKRRRKKLDK